MNESIWKKFTPTILSILITIFSFILFYFAFSKDMQNVNKELIFFVLGSITSYLSTIINYYFGSSAGSNKKDDIIKDLNSKDKQN